MARIENTTIRIQGNHHQLIVGEECCFKAGSLWLQGGQCRIDIGAETTIEEAHMAATEQGTSIMIGRDCMLAFDVDIRNGDSHSIIDLASGERVNTPADIAIGDHVWVGAHVEVLKGVTIGSGSVIGIRSVVTHDVPANAVAAGIPARVVREGVRWNRRV